MARKTSKVKEIVKPAYVKGDYQAVDVIMENGAEGKIFAHSSTPKEYDAIKDNIAVGTRFSFEYIEHEDKTNQLNPVWADILPPPIPKKKWSGGGGGGNNYYNSEMKAKIDQERVDLDGKKQIQISWAVCLDKAIMFHTAKDATAMTEAKVLASAKKMFDYSQTIFEQNNALTTKENG